MYLDDYEDDIPKEGRYSDLVEHTLQKCIRTESEINMEEVFNSRFIQAHLTEDKPYLQYDYQIQSESIPF